MNKFLSNISCYIIFFIIFFLFTFGLFINGITNIYTTSVKFVYGLDVFLTILIISIFLLRFKLRLTTINDKNLIKSRYIFIFVVLIFCVLSNLFYKTQINDAAICLNESYNMIFNHDQFNLEYFIRIPYNFFYLLYCTVFNFLFVDNAEIALRIANIIEFIVIIVLLEKILEISNHKDSIVLYRLLTLLWLPQYSLIPVSYGWIPGLCCIVISIYSLLIYLNASKYSYIVISILSAILSIALKLNYAIYVIAIILALYFKYNFKHLKIIGLFCISLIIGLNISSILLKTAYNIPSNSEIPLSIRFAMTNYRNSEVEYIGDTSQLDGWVDGSHEVTYQELKDDGLTNITSRINERASQIIASQFKLMQENPRDAINFYWHKINTTWFVKDYGIFNGYNLSFRNLEMSINSVEIIVYYICCFSYILIFFGIFMYLIKSKLKNFGFFELVVLLGLVGFFMFYLLLETQSRYVIVNIILLLPIASTGLVHALRIKRTNKIITKSLLCVCVIAISLVSCIHKNYKPIAKQSFGEYYSKVSLNQGYTYNLSLSKDTSINKINMILTGNCSECLLSINCLDMNGNSVSYQNIQLPYINDYWWDSLKINPFILPMGDYTIQITSNEPIELLIDKYNSSYIDIVTYGYTYDSIFNYRYIEENNFTNI